MGALDLAGPGVHAGGDDLVRSQFLDEHADADDVRDGVHVAHLVEVDLGDRGPVDMALCLGQDVIDGLSVLLDSVGNVQVPDDGLHIAKGVVLVMVSVLMLMMMFVAVMADFEVLFGGQFHDGVLREDVRGLFDVVVGHPEMSSKNALLLSGQGICFDTRDPDGIDFLDEFLLVFREFPEGSGDHISGGSVPTVKVQCFHKVLFFLNDYFFSRRSLISVRRSTSLGPAGSSSSSFLAFLALLKALTTRKRTRPTIRKLMMAPMKLP